MKYKFKIGDKVKISSINMLYSTYSTMANEMRLRNWNYGVFPKDWAFSKSAIIKSIKPHHHSLSKICCGIEFPNGSQYIYEQNGLELVKKRNTFCIPDKLFEL